MTTKVCRTEHTPLPKPGSQSGGKSIPMNPEGKIPPMQTIKTPTITNPEPSRPNK